MTASQTVVLDTSVLAELMKPRPDMGVMRWTNAQPIGVLAVTAVSLAELTYAMLRMSELSRSIDLRRALNEFVHDDLVSRVLPFDDLAADYFAEFVWKREQAGRPIDAAEAQVAAICRANAVTLATKDPAPFVELGVTAVDPWTAPPPVRVEVPVVTQLPELDRHGKPIPPRRPGVALGGVGASRPPRKRKPRRKKTTEPTTTTEPAAAKSTTTKGTAGAKRAGSGSTKGAAAKRAAAAKGSSGAKNGTARPGVAAGPPAPGGTRRNADPPAVPLTPEAIAAAAEGERRFQKRRAAAERLRRHIHAHALPPEEPVAPAPPASPVPPAKPASEPPPVAPGQRGARLRGPLVDAEGRPVERTADGRVRRRTTRASSDPASTARSPARGPAATGASTPPAAKGDASGSAANGRSTPPGSTAPSGREPKDASTPPEAKAPSGRAPKDAATPPEAKGASGPAPKDAPTPPEAKGDSLGPPTPSDPDADDRPPELPNRVARRSRPKPPPPKRDPTGPQPGDIDWPPTPPNPALRKGPPTTLDPFKPPKLSDSDIQELLRPPGKKPAKKDEGKPSGGRKDEGGSSGSRKDDS